MATAEIDLLLFQVVLNLPPDHSAMLLFLLALTVGSYFYMRRFRKDRTVKLGNLDTLKEVHGYETVASPMILGIKLIIVVMLFLTAVDAIQVETVYPVSDTDFAVVIDSSQSMEIPDYEASRIEFAKSSLLDWTDRIPGASNVTVVGFSGSVTQTASSVSTGQVKSGIRELDVELDDPGNRIEDGVSLGSEALEDSQKDRRMILVTDGGMFNLSAALESVEGRNIEVYIIALSGNSETDRLFEGLNASTDVDVSRPRIRSERFRALAERTGGQYFEVSDPQEFRFALEDVSTRSRKLGLQSDLFLTFFISLIVVMEMWIYSRYGAI